MLRRLVAETLRAVAQAIDPKRPVFLSELTNLDLEALELGRAQLRRRRRS